MSLKLGFANNSSPFFIAARLLGKAFSVTTIQFQDQLHYHFTHIKILCNMSVPAITSCLMGCAHCGHLVPLSFIKSNITSLPLLAFYPPLPEITENTLGSFWIEHTLKGNICDTSPSF